MAQTRCIIMEWNLICKSGPALKSKSFLVHFFADEFMLIAALMHFMLCSILSLFRSMADSVLTQTFSGL